MNLGDILGVATGGGIFGIIGAVAKGLLEIKQQKAKLEEKKIDNEHQLALVKLEIDKGTILAESAAFNASQDSAKSEADSFEGISALAQTPLQRWLVLGAAVLRYATRSLLTWGSHLMAFVVFFTLTADMQQAVLLQLFAMASTYGGWWFGSRQVFRFNK